MAERAPREILTPTPRWQAGRPAKQPIVTHRSTQDEELRSHSQTASEIPRRPLRMPNVAFPMLFSSLAAAIVYFLLYFFLPTGPGRRLVDAGRPLIIAAQTQEQMGSPGASDRQKNAGSAPESPVLVVPALPASRAREVLAGEHADQTATPAVLANRALDAFLRATDAASRVDWVEPATSPEELAASILGAPLPEVAQIYSDLPQQRPAEQLVDYPYRVSFAIKGKPSIDYAILVRQRGGAPPKVFLPAFLDLVGGRLADFTADPNGIQPGKFHVILEPVIGCRDKAIPSPDRKFTFKLLASSLGKETARAYASNGSPLRRLVDEADYPIRWGVRGRATVTIRWNREEDPARPYLELVEINSPDWNL